MIRARLTMTKKLLIALVLSIATFQFAWERHKRIVAEREGPEEITEPVFAEFNTRMMMQGRLIELFMYVKSASAAECERMLATLEKDFTAEAARVGLPPRINASRCTEELGQSQLDLFENRPTSVTYLSLPRVRRADREVRLILWGLPAAASDENCNRVLRSPSRLIERRDNGRCIRSLMI